MKHLLKFEILGAEIFYSGVTILYGHFWCNSLTVNLTKERGGGAKLITK